MSVAIPTGQALYEAYKAEVQARQASLTDFSEGSALDALAGGGVILADQSIRIGVDATKARMIATAEGDDLDAAVTDKYPTLTRREASASVGTLRFTRGGSVAAITVPAGTSVQGTVNGRTVTVTTDTVAVMAALSSTLDVDATCTVTGSAGNVAIGVLTTLPTALVDDATATVTNLARFVGGADEETDDAYRARAQAYPLTLRRATASALETGALTVAGVAYATVDESSIETDDRVYIYVADADGRGNTALSDDVDAIVPDWRAAGILVTVLAATREEVVATVTVYVRTGKATDALTAACRAAVIAYTDGLGPNTAIYLSALEAACIATSTDVRGAEATSTDSDDNVTIDPAAPQNSLRIVTGGLSLTLVEVSA